MPPIVNNIKAILTGLKVTFKNFVQPTVTVNYPWEYDDLPKNSRGMLRMVDFHDKKSIHEKSSWYPGTRWAPCSETCPAHVDARGYVTLAAEGKYREGLDMLRRTYPFVGTLGRICPAPCEKGCSRSFTNSQPCAIRDIKRGLADWELQQNSKEQFDYNEYCCKTPLNGKSVGIVGAGPAGYQCAMLLRLCGFEVHMYETKSVPGGFLTHAIPNYRLPRDIVNGEMERIHTLPGVTLHLNTTIGKDIAFDELTKKHDEVVIAAGAWEAYRLGLDNEAKPMVWGGEDFLEEQLFGRLTEVPAQVVVVGGGNTGFDCARTCRRLGADVTMIYRRTRREMPSEDEEIEDGEAEGVKLEWLTAPTKLIIENGQLTGLEVIKNRLGDKDASGRRRPVAIAGSEEVIKCQMVITALGRQVKLPWLPTEVKQNRNGTIVVDKSGHTSLDKVWACGDVVKVATVVAAIGGADAVSLAIAEKYQALPEKLEFLYPYKDTMAIPQADGTPTTPEAPQVQRRGGLGWQKPVPPNDVTKPFPERLTRRDRPFREADCKKPMAKKAPAERIKDFNEAALGYSLEEMSHEASRCFGCAAEMCVGCGVCVDTCPDACIFLESRQNDQDRTYPGNYAIDFTKCCFCGLCSEACPTKSLRMVTNFEMAVFDKRDIYMTYPRLNLSLVREAKGLEPARPVEEK